ncbi:hypothetical protein [Legionella clemsonensis]|nr:hypothetical protein [Legionella clemsonensis]
MSHYVRHDVCHWEQSEGSLIGAGRHSERLSPFEANIRKDLRPPERSEGSPADKIPLFKRKDPLAQDDVLLFII